ncbi:MAG: hypothetical protein JXA67_13980 [Micromonosporaceae bacterium]|nr:hypothetical protein [Micromonosporaceae bacterium]
MIVRVWEARAHPEGFADLMGWICDIAVPSIELHPQHIATEVLSSTDHRLMVISKWRGNQPMMFVEPPGHLVDLKPRWRDYALVDR